MSSNFASDWWIHVVAVAVQIVHAIVQWTHFLKLCISDKYALSLVVSRNRKACLLACGLGSLESLWVVSVPETQELNLGRTN